MREKHRDEVDELERKLSKKERERKELEDDCRDLKNELESSKGEVRDLKVRRMPLKRVCGLGILIPKGHAVGCSFRASDVSAHGSSRAECTKSDKRSSATRDRRSYLVSAAGGAGRVPGERESERGGRRPPHSRDNQKKAA